MSDSVDPTWWAAAGAFGTALVGGLVKLVGTRKERSDADASSDAATERAAALAFRAAERADEETARHRIARDTCEERLAAMDTRVRRLEVDLAEHAACGPRIAHLEREQATARQMLGDLLRNASTPPSGLYTGDDVRRAVAAEEQTP